MIPRNLCQSALSAKLAGEICVAMSPICAIFGLRKKTFTVNKILEAAVSALSNLKTWKFWRELTIMTVGMLMVAAAVYYFLVPSTLVVGALAGLAILLSSLFGGAVSVSMLVLILNVFLIILALRVVGKEFGAKTIYTALILGPFMDLMDRFYPYQNLIAAGSTSVMGDAWFDLLVYVVLIGAAQAVLFSINTSTGGLDIVAMIVKKYFRIEIGASLAIVGIVICALGFFVNPPKLVIIGLLGTWINGIVVDYFTERLNRRKRVCIISKDHEKIRQFIINDLVRGCSLYDVTGGFTGEKMVELQTLLNPDECNELMRFLEKNHIQSFTTVTNLTEIHGIWRSADRGWHHHHHSHF